MLSEYTLVARAMPDEHQKLGTAICSVGLCPDKGLIRVYPLLAEVPMSQWRTYEVAIAKDASDTTLNGVLQKWHCIVEHEMWFPLPKAPEPREHLVDRLLEVIDEMHDGEADWSEVWKARKALR
jgi:hypothetical protein